MPSIIEVDTIKNKTGTQNTVLSTDGSGNVTIANSTFNGAIASSATGTFSGTIGSNATFPSDFAVKYTTSMVGNGVSGTIRTASSNGEMLQSDGSSYFDIQPTMVNTSNSMIVTFTLGFDCYGTASGNNIGCGLSIYWSNDNFSSHEAQLTSSQNHDFFFQGTSESGYYAIYGQAVLAYKHSPSTSTPKYRLYGSVRHGSGRSLRVSQKGCFMQCIEIKA